MRRIALACGFALVAWLAAVPAFAQCHSSGLITRIDGTPDDVRIKRGRGRVSRPRVLEILCSGDVVEVSGRSQVSLFVDGAGRITLAPGKSFQVGPRSGAPSASGNAYRLITEEMLPDMKRLPWDLRTKGAADPVRFIAPAGGVQVISPGRDRLLVRMASGVPPMRVELRRVGGETVGAVETTTQEAMFTGLDLAPGPYLLVAHTAGGSSAELRFDVGEAPPPSAASLAIGDADLARVLHALEIARSDPSRWSLEAAQLVAMAPADSVDRERLLALIDSYGD